MKTFRLSADCEFEADDIEDAMTRLARHLLRVADGQDSDLLIAGSITIGAPAGLLLGSAVAPT